MNFRFYNFKKAFFFSFFCFLENHFFEIGQGPKIQIFIKNCCFLKSYDKMVVTVRIFKKFAT